MNKETGQHGGKREGAGRKPEYREFRRVLVSLEQQQVDDLDEFLERLNRLRAEYNHYYPNRKLHVSRNKVIADAVGQLLLDNHYLEEIYELEEALAKVGVNIR